jgi:HK97 gp10 family phage protein
MNINIQIKNIKEIKHAFGLAPNLMRKNLNAAIHKTVLMIGRDSRILTPVDTGRLRASTREKFSDLYGEVGTHVSYDVFVHNGTRYMRARPFLRDAVNRVEPQVQIFFRDAVQNTLSSIGKAT